MTAEIIYGIDFRAGKEEAPLCNAPDAMLTLVDLPPHNNALADTAPSEYCADDSGDCA